LTGSAYIRLIPLILLGLLACTSPPPPVPLPQLTITKNWFPGLPQEGSKILDPDFEIPSERVYEVRIVAWLLSRELPGKFDSINKRTRLILATHGGNPVLPSSAIAEGCKIVMGARAREAKSWIEIGGSKEAVKLLSTKGILPRGLTIEFLVEQAEVEESEGDVRRSLSFCVSRGLADKLTLSILSAEIEPSEHGRPGLLDQELIILDRAPAAGKDPLFLMWRARLARLHRQWVAVYLEVLPRTTGKLDEDLAECRASLLRRDKEVTSRAGVVSAGEAHGIDLVSAMESLSMVSKRRAMLVNQAEKTGATLALDLGLSGDESVLAAYTLRLIPKLKGKKREELLPAKLGWLLEREAWGLLLLHLEADPLPPEALALAVRHSGEMARYPGVLTSLLEESESVEALHKSILMENRAILGSNMPGPRIRAFLWLESQGEDLGDYQPMSSQKERRKAYLSLVQQWESERRQ
jgi:hypothetical protein